MDCNNCGSMISELYDGEPVSPEAVGHIVKCGSCRERLRDYAAISAEMRLLAAQEREKMKMPTMMREAMPKKNSFLFALRKTMRVPRFAAAACALVIIVLAGAWAHTRAQNTPLWFQYLFSFNVDGYPASVGGVMQVCGSGCERPFTLSQKEHLAAILDVERIEGGKAYLTVRVKRFASLPDIKHLTEEMTDVPPLQYTYKPGKPIQIPVAGGGEVEMDGVIATSSEGVVGWHDFPFQPGEYEIVARLGVLIRDGQVIAEMPGSGSATGPDAGFYAYVPGQGLFAFGLAPFDGGIVGSADRGQIRFTENGAKYLLLCGSQITGGDQPRTIWVLHLPDYLPSQHDAQAKDNAALFGTGSDVGFLLKHMGAINQQ